ncbi:MAG: YvcK family protein, partial [Caldilineaceae bacterium]|nr:YvcK family protein [Caldilineaceae bacterium]
ISESLYRYHSRRGRGPNIVAIGGGSGLPSLLRGLSQHTANITAIVTMADDGGSSGRLRHQMGVLPPGDFRNNIAALSDAEELMTRLFQYRFPNQDRSGGSSELAGHSFGNLFIATMAAITGSFEKGLAECARVLAVRGRVLPSTLEHIVLCAEIASRDQDGKETWRIAEGESNLPNAGGRSSASFCAQIIHALIPK